MYGRTVLRTHLESTANSAQTYKVGALAKYRCERGYKMIGDPLITCEENGTWKGNVPECVCKLKEFFYFVKNNNNFFSQMLIVKIHQQLREEL